MTTANRLIHEKSPYLLQHAYNPVDWHPWSAETFAKAKAANKPLFLSIGYATCHWCHVMEKESFEDPEAAEELNQTFICIKVDREERPDVDAVYMTACQMITGSGGWPLTIFMTPDKKPFFAATYLPKQNRYGRAGIIELCQQVRSLWTGNPASVASSADELIRHMGQVFEFSKSDASLDEKVLESATEQIRQSFDSTHGGFDGPPKFPTPQRLQFLLHQYHFSQDRELLQMVTHTLTAMRQGGMWDHVGFGFHRYATDAHWLLPHFEKMLYDQALLAMIYLEAYQITQTPLFAQTAHEILTYVMRDMTSADGGFYTAEDADSEGEEGKFYVWPYSEWMETLESEKGPAWAEVMNILPQGNFNDEATRRPTGVNIAHLTHSQAHWANAWGIFPEQFDRQWETVRQTLFDARKKRIAPLKDDKILTDWNGLMIAAFAMGARILGTSKYEAVALKAADFIWKKMRNSKGELQHRYRDGETAIDANANDYAFYTWGLLELYRTTFHVTHLERAQHLTKQMIDAFWNSSGGGFFLTSKHTEDLPIRPMELYDGATPSANSVALCNLIRLARLTGITDWEQRANEMFQTFGNRVKAQPTAYTHFLMAVGYALGRSCEVVLVGDPGNDKLKVLLNTLNQHYTPGLGVVLKTDQNKEDLANLAAYSHALKTDNQMPTAYVCKGFNCNQPTTNSAEMINMIKKYSLKKATGT